VLFYSSPNRFVAGVGAFLWWSKNLVVFLEEILKRQKMYCFICFELLLAVGATLFLCWSSLGLGDGGGGAWAKIRTKMFFFFVVES
jgi:hypothetical protein